MPPKKTSPRRKSPRGHDETKADEPITPRILAQHLGITETALSDFGISNPQELSLLAGDMVKTTRQDVIQQLVNEGANILDEGIAQRASDIDVIYAFGYGFPRYRGGPMFYADLVGLDKVLTAIRRYSDSPLGVHWKPAPLLEKLAAEGGKFNE